MPTAQCWLAHHAKDADVGKLFEIQQQAPIHASYLMKSLNTSTPEGWDGFRGSALDLRKAFERIRELGGSPALFTFDRAPLMGKPNYADHVGKWASQGRDRTLGEGFRDLMPSPSAPSLVKARVGEAVRWVREFGLDEIHFDTAATTGGSLGMPSYRPGTPQRPNEVPHYFTTLSSFTARSEMSAANTIPSSCCAPSTAPTSSVPSSSRRRHTSSRPARWWRSTTRQPTPSSCRSCPATRSLGQWFHQSQSKYFGKRFVGEDRMEPRPVRLRVPTRLTNPQVKFHGDRGDVAVQPKISEGTVEVEVADPTCFALEIFSGPSLTLDVPSLAAPGETAKLTVRVAQPEPEAGEVAFSLSPGWPGVESLRVPAKPLFQAEVPIRVPSGVFGRNYPLKAVLRTPTLKRTSATHLRVMEPLTVLYGFDVLAGSKPGRKHCIDPGERARLTVTCVNNTPDTAPIEVEVSGSQVRGTKSQRVEGIDPTQLGNVDNALHQWTEKGGAVPANAFVATFDFDCTGVQTEPARIVARIDGRVAFETEAYPRTRLMDLNGDWKVGFMPKSRARVGGAERLDNLDTEAVTPSVWDGNWESRTTPIRFEAQARKDHSWAVYRRLVYLPPEWRGADVRLRLSHMGAPWGQGGTLNLVYVNGWPAGRIGTSGECSLTSFLVFGGWNLLAVASMSPNSLVDPYLFVRDAPAPERLQPAAPVAPPEGAFLLLGSRPTGQGLELVFIKGTPEDDHRRTEVAKGGEHQFIYCAIADAFLREPDGPVEIEVEYLDRDTSAFGLAYDSTDPKAPLDGAFKDAPTCQCADSGEWKTHVFTLPDARLANRQHQGADFRLFAGEEDLHVRRVEVRRKR